jgi:antibiotic biosynthesis monooxygenase (ABM) superfamily enzyme
VESGEERITTMVSRRVKPGRESEFERWAHGIITASTHFPGQLTASVLHDPGGRDHPLVLAFLTFVAPHVRGWPLPARAALFPFVLLTLMTFVVMPVVTRFVAPWLWPAGADLTSHRAASVEDQ